MLTLPIAQESEVFHKTLGNNTCIEEKVIMSAVFTRVKEDIFVRAFITAEMFRT